MKDQNSRLAIPFPNDLKSDLVKMSEETGISQTQLVILATNSLLANYKEKGSFVFVDLLNPDHKKVVK